MFSDRSKEDIEETILLWLDRQGAHASSEASLLSDLLVGAGLSLEEFDRALGGLLTPEFVRREPADHADASLAARFWITPAGQAAAKERFQPLEPWRNLGFQYRTNATHLTFRGRPLQGVDRASFEILNVYWARDKKSVFEMDRKRQADRDSFVVLNCLFARDKDTVFCFGGPAKFLHVESFEVLDDGGFCDEDRIFGPTHAGFARDKGGVYWCDLEAHKPRLVKSADAGSFTPLGFGFAKDQKHCYFNYTRLKGAKPDSFELLSQRFSRDEKRVFCHSVEVAGADRDSFEVYPPAGRGTRFFARDKSAVYYRQDRVEDADPATFKPTGNTEGADGTRTWKFVI
jgi:hypothetical protein